MSLFSLYDAVGVYCVAPMPAWTGTRWRGRGRWRRAVSTEPGGWRGERLPLAASARERLLLLLVRLENADVLDAPPASREREHVAALRLTGQLEERDAVVRWEGDAEVRVPRPPPVAKIPQEGFVGLVDTEGNCHWFAARDVEGQQRFVAARVVWEVQCRGAP